MNYFFRYDVEINKLDGVNIELMQGSFMQNYIEIDKRISDNGQVYIDFALPKSKIFRSIALNKNEKTGNYLLHIPSRVVQEVGNVSFQVVVYVDNQIIKTNVLEHITVLPSINAVEEITQEELKLIDQVLSNDKLQNDKIEEHSLKILGQEDKLRAFQEEQNTQNNKLNQNVGRLDTVESKQLQHANSLTEISDNMIALNNSFISKKFEMQVVYDYKNPDLCYGAPEGLKHREEIAVDVSGFRMLFINYQYDRNMTMLMDLSEKNSFNDFYINSNIGLYELGGKCGFLGFEVIVNKEKTKISANNIVKSALNSAELVVHKSAMITKIYGLV